MSKVSSTTINTKDFCQFLRPTASMLCLELQPFTELVLPTGLNQRIDIRHHDSWLGQRLGCSLWGPLTYSDRGPHRRECSSLIIYANCILSNGSSFQIQIMRRLTSSACKCHTSSEVNYYINTKHKSQGEEKKYLLCINNYF